MTTKLKESFEVESKHSPFYTNGNVEWHDNILFCQNGPKLSLFNTDEGIVKLSLGDLDEETSDTISTFNINVKQNQVITAHAGSLLKLWTLDGILQNQWKSFHNGPIARLVFNLNVSDKINLASGGSDGTIRLWNLEHKSCEYSLKGSIGVISLVEFHPAKGIIFGSGNDGVIHVWSSENGRHIQSFRSHTTRVTSLAFCEDDRYFISSARDKLLILWDIETRSAIATIPVYESLETVICLPRQFEGLNVKPSKNHIFAATAGENGVVRVWNVSKMKEVFKQTNSLVSKAKETDGLAIKKLLYNHETKMFAVISADQNIILHNSNDFSCSKQFGGFSDQILDLKFLGKNNSHLAVAANCADIKLYKMDDMSCQIVKGHTDIVLALNVSPANVNLLVSSGKDNTIRLWLLQNDVLNFVAVGKRHMASVETVALSNLTASFVVSASQDKMLKLWDLDEHLAMDCTKTVMAHEKDINCVSVSPNDAIIASASADKTAKLWSNSLQLIGTLKGHRRGLWYVRFSPVDQVVLTSSTDASIRLWSIENLNCLKVFTGHTANVYRAEFISNGLQILSTGGDGLLKLFDLKSSECVCTLGEEEVATWALAIKNNESGFVTGDSKSQMIFWKDVTLEKKQERDQENEELILQEQKLSNYVQSNKLVKALKYAIHLDKPFQVLKIIEKIIRTSRDDLEVAIEKLRCDQKESLLKYAVKWNTNSRYAVAAQYILNIMMKNELLSRDLKPTTVSISDIIEQALPYTERHLKRVDNLTRDFHFLQYVIRAMEPHTN